MFPCRRQSYKKVLKRAIPRNGDATVYQLLSIARNFKSQYLCSRNRKGAVMLAILEWIGLNCSSELSTLKSRAQTDIRTSFFFVSLQSDKVGILSEPNDEGTILIRF